MGWASAAPKPSRAASPRCSRMRKSIRHARLFLPHVRKSRDFYLDFLDLISVGLAALAQLSRAAHARSRGYCGFQGGVTVFFIPLKNYIPGIDYPRCMTGIFIRFS